MKYIDSSVFIGAFLPTDPNQQVCRKVVDDIISGNLPAVISIFGLAEIGGFFARNISQKVASKHVTALQRAGNLQIYYADNFDSFMNSVLAVSVSTGLPGANSIHFVSAISLPAVDEIITLDHHFKRVSNQIRVTILSEESQR